MSALRPRVLSVSLLVAALVAGGCSPDAFDAAAFEGTFTEIGGGTALSFRDDGTGYFYLDPIAGALYGYCSSEIPCHEGTCRSFRISGGRTAWRCVGTPCSSDADCPGGHDCWLLTYEGGYCNDADGGAEPIGLRLDPDAFGTARLVLTTDLAHGGVAARNRTICSGCRLLDDGARLSCAHVAWKIGSQPADCEFRRIGETPPTEGGAPTTYE